MRKLFDFIGTLILTLLIISIFIITAVVCLDVFEIIEIPEKYSLIKYLNSKKDNISSVQAFIEEKINDEDLEKIWDNTESIIVELEGNNVTTIYLDDFYQEQQKDVYNQTPSSFKYYDQLDEYAKKMYKELEENKENLKTGMYVIDFDKEFNELLNTENGSTILNNSFQLAVNAFAYDHPEVFYIDITKMYLLTQVTTRLFSKTYKVSIGPNGESYLFDQYQNESDVELAINQIEQIRDGIKQNIKGTTYDKIKYIHDYLLVATEYETTEETYNNYNIYGALINRKSVCEGYAKAFKYMLDEINIPCVVVGGIGRNSAGVTENHAWNYVWLEGKWYAVDVTWDDPIIIGNGIVSDKTKYKYFLKGTNTFFTDHIEDGNIVDSGIFTYPILSDVDY